MPVVLPGAGAAFAAAWNRGLSPFNELGRAILAFSGLTDMTRIGTTQRRFVSGETVTTYPAMPAGQSRAQVTADWADADRLNSTKTLVIALEYSVNGGVDWVTGGSVTCAGDASWVIERTQPSLLVGAPPAGALLRIRETPNATGLDAGVALEGVA